MKTTVLKAYPDQDAETNIPGLEALAKADLAVFFLRWRQLPASQVAHIQAYLDSGKPLMGFRTSSHAFNYPKGHALEQWNAFGAEAFGTPPGWGKEGHTHYGHESSTDVSVIPAAAEHPVLTGCHGSISRPVVALPGETQLATRSCSGVTARQSRQSKQACSGESSGVDLEEQVWWTSVLYNSRPSRGLQGGGCAAAGDQRHSLELGTSDSKSVEGNVQVGCALSRVKACSRQAAGSKVIGGGTLREPCEQGACGCAARQEPRAPKFFSQLLIVREDLCSPGEPPLRRRLQTLPYVILTIVVLFSSVRPVPMTHRAGLAAVPGAHAEWQVRGH